MGYPPDAPASSFSAPPPVLPDFRPTHVVPRDGLPAWEAPDPSLPTDPLDAFLPVQLLDRVGDWAQILCSNGWSAWVDGRLLVGVPKDPPAAGQPPARTADPRPLIARAEDSLGRFRRAAEELAAGRSDGETFRRRTRGLRVGMVVDGESMWLFDAEHERWVYCDGEALATYATSGRPAAAEDAAAAGPAGPGGTQVVQPVQPPAGAGGARPVTPVAEPSPEPTQVVTPTAPPTGADPAQVVPPPEPVVPEPTRIVDPAAPPAGPEPTQVVPPATPAAPEPTQVVTPTAQPLGPEPTQVVPTAEPAAAPEEPAGTEPPAAPPAGPEPTQVVPAPGADGAAAPPAPTQVVPVAEPAGSEATQVVPQVQEPGAPEPTRVVDLGDERDEGDSGREDDRQAGER
ncbi:hypothetical protein ABZO31_02055 [Streptomyces sp. HUAS MG47]|uniref:hypothetical protein n=1 Tax=Streptomyces solicamelliae TaxID=3231716 RepID=UPI003877F935